MYQPKRLYETFMNVFLFSFMQGLLPSKQRAEMCKLALQQSDWVKTNLWEAEQDKWTETARVSQSL